MSITHEELKLQAATEEGLVERLRTEKKVLLNKIHQEGLELGIRSSSKLSYQDFQHFERVQPLAASLDEEAMEYLWTFLDTRGYSQEARIKDPDFAHLLEISPQSRILFAQGWLDGVIAVWQTIKAQVESDN